MGPAVTARKEPYEPQSILMLNLNLSAKKCLNFGLSSKHLKSVIADKLLDTVTVGYASSISAVCRIY